jgi:branched-chain amino acid aminotransferase
MVVFINEKFVPETKAAIPVNNRSFRYGDGCFETIKCINDSLPLFDLHFNRLMHTLSLLQFKIPKLLTKKHLYNTILVLAQKNKHSKLARIRLTVYRGNGGLYDAENNNPNILIQSWPMAESINHFNPNGLVVGIYSHAHKTTDAFANCKTNNFLVYTMAAMYAQKNKLNDALVLNNKGTIADSTIANLFIVKGKNIYTPPLSSGAVHGVMKQKLMPLLIKNGFIVKEKTLKETDLQKADEAFLTNAIFGIKWIKEINGTVYKNYTALKIFEILKTQSGFIRY